MPEANACRQRAQDASKKLEAELAKYEPNYNASVAAQLFQAEMTEQASCFQPQYDCLAQHLTSVGENREFKMHLQRNLKLIQEREELMQSLPQPSVQECMAAAEADYGRGVANAYARYSKKPNTLFRVLLHQAYVKLHSGQVKCLKHQAK